MANEFVNATSAKGSGASRAVSKPSGISNGDLIILAADHDSSGHVFDTPSGFTALDSRGGSGDGFQLFTWGRIADGSEGSTFTVSATGSGSIVMAVICAVYRGVGDLDAHNGQTGIVGTGGSPPRMFATAPSVTPTVVNDLLVCAWGWRTPYQTTFGTIAYPAGVTGRKVDGDSSDIAIALGDILTLGSTSATGDKDASVVSSETFEYSGGQQLTFKSAAPGGLSMLV